MNEFNINKLIAYLALISGLSLSIVAEYYSIVGLTAIFAASVIPIVIMGIAIGLSKVVGTVWLKQNWDIAPTSIKIYLSAAIVVLMVITSIGIFGFLSKAHSDQSLVSGDVLAKIAVYDEKIKTAKDNIDANRKALKQMDEAVDQVMGRSQDEKGADKAVAIRRTQQKERARLQTEIQAEQKTITSLSEERAPIAAEVRKVEAEVGPIKYIAAFVYGSTDTSILERAVTWIIILIIPVFDPLAVILLLSSQISFQNIRQNRGGVLIDGNGTIVGFQSAKKDPDVLEQDPVEQPKYEKDDGPLTEEQLAQLRALAGSKNKEIDPVDLWNKLLLAVSGEVKERATEEKPYVWKTTVFPPVTDSYIQNEEQAVSNQWNNITQATQISEKDYHEAIERNIEEMVDSVRKGILPFYKVPHEIQDQVKQKLQNVGENNSNNPS